MLFNFLQRQPTGFLSRVTRAERRTPQPAGLNSPACLHRPDCVHVAGRQMPYPSMAPSHNFTPSLIPIMSFWKMQGSGLSNLSKYDYKQINTHLKSILTLEGSEKKMRSLWLFSHRNEKKAMDGTPSISQATMEHKYRM